jgi:hypothetical protein
MKDSKQKKEVLVKIAYEETYREKVVDIDTSGLVSKGLDYRGRSRGFEGDLSIELDDGGWWDITGEFGPKDFEIEYGFTLISRYGIEEEIKELKNKRAEIKKQINDLKGLL